MSLSTAFPALRPSLLLDFSNSETIDPRITFTRASTARYYDANTVAKAEENLLTQSQAFQSWALSALTVTADSTTAPDGTSTADTLTETAATGGHNAFQTLTFAAVPYTFSVFLKANTRTWAYLRLSVGAWFNLSTGTVGTVQFGVTASISNAGNGWYRCSITRTLSAGQNFPTVFLATADGVDSYAGDGTSSIFAWGGQLEERSAATAYTATTTAPITRYQPQLLTAAAGVARLDHDPITRESRGLLIEESRSNLLTFSEDFGNAAWAKDANRGTFNTTTVAPDGTLTARILIAGPQNFGYAYRTVTMTAGAAYTYSIYAKAGSAGFAYLGITGFGNLYVNLQTLAANTLPGVTVAITAAGNGWVRIAATFTPAGATQDISFGASAASGAQAMPAGTEAYFWGAQLEAGSFATSYIARPDATAASRAADAASMTGANFSSWYRADEGTMYAEASIPAYSLSTIASHVQFSVSDGTTNNEMELRGYSTGASGFVFDSLGRVGNVTQFDTTERTFSTPNTVVKNALSFKVNDIINVVGGQAASTDTSALIPVVDRAGIGNLASSSQFAQHIRKLAFYPRALTSAQLQALTR